MKNWQIVGVLTFLIIGIVLMSGCTNTGSTSAAVSTPTPQIVYVTVFVTPTPTPTVARAQDPIIGVWRYYSPDDGYDQRYHFYADGTVTLSIYIPDIKETRVYHGTWNAQGSNSYVLRGTPFGDYETFKYEPTQPAIYDTKYSAIMLTPYQGDVAAASSGAVSSAPASTPTYSSQSSSSSTHFTGNGDDVRSFTATGSGLRVFTMSYSGKSNFAVVLYDGDGEYVELLANEIGSYSGRSTEKLYTGKYTLEITASGPWTIDISPT